MLVEHLETRLSNFEHDTTQTFKQLLKAYSALQKNNLSLKSKLAQAVQLDTFELATDLLNKKLDLLESTKEELKHDFTQKLAKHGLVWEHRLLAAQKGHGSQGQPDWQT
jgi:hypothetical protein